MTDDPASQFHLCRQAKTALGAIAFYTCFPIPHHWSLNFDGIARWATAVGLLIGSLLGLLDLGLQQLTMPVLVRSAVIVGVWLALTGGLHLDGAMDTADGLAVLDPKRRLEVMADSHSGAFGVMAAAMILLLKVTALGSLESDRWIALIAAAGWGRWGQLVAIVRYPYLKPTGKGAFHKPAIRSAWDILPSTVLLLVLGGIMFYLQPNHWSLVVGITLGGAGLALVPGAWFHHQLGGHTGDTYGAVVEWTEALLLCGLTMLG
ncbi:MAG TPA: adenosylcobinamide-GDP ribazoletransferase [Microcoleaceae cyanobacterium]|jgi:adenosylcobinamide-GDP ribazoletransferase